MFRHIALILTFTMLAFATFAQGWFKVYPYTNCATSYCFSEIIDVETTLDNGYIALENVITPAFLGLPDTIVSILKVDADGNIQWRKKLLPNVAAHILHDGISIIPTSDTNYIVTAIEFTHPSPTSSFHFHYTPIGVKLDKNGDLVWKKSFTSHGENDFMRTNGIETTDGDFVFTYVKSKVWGSNGYWPTSIEMKKILPQGNLIWTQTTAQPYWVIDIVAQPNNEIVLLTKEQSSNTTKFHRLDSSGNFVASVLNIAGNFVNKMITTPNKGLIGIDKTNAYAKDITLLDSTFTVDWTSDFSNTPNPVNLTDIGFSYDNQFIVLQDDTTTTNSRVHKIDHSGNLFWSTQVSDLVHMDDILSSVCLDNEGNNVLGGSYFRDAALWKMDTLGQIFTTLLIGNVYFDGNSSCQKEAGEQGLQKWIIEVQQGGVTYYQLTDTLGNYSINISTGTATVNAYPPYQTSLWQSCPATQSVVFNNIGDTLSADLGMQPLAFCPSLAVDITTSQIRQCCINTYSVNYCNLGTQDAQSAYIEVDIDDDLIVTGSSIPFSGQNGNTYTFPVGTVAFGDCHQFTIDVIVDTANTILGQTHCTEAHIFPDTLCTPVANWSGAEVNVSGECIGDSVRFTVKNIGTANMSQSKEYFVIEDHVIMLQNTYQLPQNDSIIITVPSNGSTYRLLAEQENGHPYSLFPTAAVEGCSTGSFSSLGFINNFPFDDIAPFLSIDCSENIGSYDPNDKQATPNGWNEEHFILANTTINYKIRFQNTGTDTAFIVTIRDTIDTNVLDLTTLQLGASSHNYQAQIIGQNVLEFTFNNIMLPDSNINEAASHGFVQFKIDQQSNNSIGTLIENSAAIYFDFNTPVITNTAFHTIGQMPFFVKTNEIETLPEGISVSVFPNPILEKATFRIDDEMPRDLTFTIYDAMGRVVRQQSFTNTHRFDIYKNNLSSGLYFYTILENGVPINQGKILVR